MRISDWSSDVCSSDLRGATDRTGHVRGACFELVRHLVPGTAVESDRADHVAAALPGLHRFEVFALRVQHAESGRAIQLVRRERVEIDIKLEHVDRQMGEDRKSTRLNYSH